jgi:hypothetical protein
MFTASRSYMTMSGEGFMFLGWLSVLVPLCNVLHLLGVPTGMAFWPCWMVVLFGAILFTICFVFLTIAIVVSF